MLWVDHTNYYGPDRRLKPHSFRLRERRQDNVAGNPPPLSTAMRQLRMHVIDARGAGAEVFADRAHGVAMLADVSGEHDAAAALSALAITAMRGRERDVRELLFRGLDRAHAQLRTYH